ncbi:MAG: ATP-binding protein [Paludibacteraceae bacterium]|nr:ATP-binding protein [Paludibacteraceae bacterium]
MKIQEKENIKTALAEYCERMGSQNKAANSLKGVSSATVSQLLNGNWDLITDEMWRNIATQIGYDNRKWVVVETRGYKRMTQLLTDAQENSLVFAVTGDAGCGKSEAVKTFARNHQNVYNLSCSEYWNRKHFMTELLQNMGVDYTGCTVSEMMSEILYNLKRKENPLLVLDEADKLSDQVLYFFISLYNHLEDHCGIVMCATDYLEKRIKKGVRCNRKGYKEIYSRCGRKFIPMQQVNAEDIAAVCVANGISDAVKIDRIVDESECDLRRVKRCIHAYKSSENYQR